MYKSIVTVLLLALSGAALAQEPMLPVHYDADTGRVLLEIRELDTDLLYTNTLATGVGTTSPLLDRGQMGDHALVRFERHGPRVLLIRQNAGHRALTDNAALVRSVAESFPRSVLASFEIVTGQDGALRVDATDFFLSDVFDVAGSLKTAERGEASIDRDRSYIDVAATGAFPLNTEVRGVLTFTVKEPDRVLAQHVPDARSVTVAQQHSFMRLPDDGYQPRAFHPRAGVFPHVFFDFAQGFDTDYRQRWIWRWRLVPSDRAAYLAGELVPPVEPIVYHLDPAIPEPYRTAFREGGMWWNQVFEKAGFRDAFEIRDLPDGANPLDARYNVLHWVHRRERGPSIGPNYRDPRTGEIVRAIVRMDSYRSLVNHDIWMGFRPALGEGADASSEPMAMARRRQHTAHEIGHTLGLAHNFIAAVSDRASVMDYPVALATLNDTGRVTLENAYAPGPGAYDEIAIRYAYTWFPDAESERAGLAAILKEAEDAGLRFITGGHAGPGGSIPDASTWVEGNGMFAALERTRAVRRVLIDAFDERALAAGEPHWVLNRRFAHVYLHHRSALYGVIKHLGGLEFAYTLKDDTLEPTRRVPPVEQRRALQAVIQSLAPDELRIPDRVVALIPPAPIGWDSGWQWDGDPAPLASDSGDAFNPVYVAHAFAQETLDAVLHAERANRIVQFHATDSEQPSLNEVLTALVEATWVRSSRGLAGGDAAMLRVTQRALLDALLDLGGNENASAMTRAAVERQLRELQSSLRPARRALGSSDDASHRALAHRHIERYLAGEDDPADRPRPAPIPLPWP